MDSELDYEFPPLLRAYKNGHIERLLDTQNIPPSVDPQTGVSSKDVVIVPEINLSARLFLPPNLTTTTTHTKVPLIIYFHGGAFCISSAFSVRYHNYVNLLVSSANVVALSVDYRLAPEHVLPVAYEDSLHALKWAASHCEGTGPEAWLNEFADFNRVFLAGDSAGANIAHNMAMMAGQVDMKLLGIVLVHPYFWGVDPIGYEATDLNRKASVDRCWPFVCPSMPGNDDPRINPMAAGAPSISNLGCTRVLVCVAEKDILKDRGWLYYETLKKCGWKGVADIIENEGEDHVFHLYDLACDKAKDFIKQLAAFLNQHSL